MGKIWKGVLVVWAFIADTAQIAGVDWKVVLGYAMGVGGGAWVIGLVTDVGPFPLTVGVLAAGFLAAGISAFSRYRKLPPTTATLPTDLSRAKKQFQEELRERAQANRAALVGAKPKKPRYAAPADSKGIDITKVTNKELGKLMEAIGGEIQQFNKTRPYNAPQERVISDFQKILAPTMLWVYEEAKRRSFKDEYLEQFYLDPSGLRAAQIEWIGKELITLGASIALHAD